MTSNSALPAEIRAEPRVDKMGYVLDGPELSPCPCCGSPAKLVYNDHRNKEYIARCLAAVTCGLRGGSWGEAEAAAYAWNLRAAR